MWKMLQLNKPQDFVICTGKQHSIKDFINLASKYLKYQLLGRAKVLTKKHIIQKINV